MIGQLYQKNDELERIVNTWAYLKSKQWTFFN